MNKKNRDYCTLLSFHVRALYYYFSFFLSDVFVSSFYEREMFVFSNDERVLPPSSRKLSIGVDFSL